MSSLRIAVVVALAGCGGGNGGMTGDDNGTLTGVDAAPPPVKTLVANWLLKLPTGKDEIVMTSHTSGTAQLYWYDSGEAHWQVQATDDGAGNAMLTLTCTSSDCAMAAPIVYSCTYSFVALTCTGLSGGYQNNYKGDHLNLTKEST